PDTFGRLLAGGIVAWLGLQTLVNLGAVTGLLPIAGVPLPLVSYGGSSLVVTLAAVGVLVSIGRAGAVPAAVRSTMAADARSKPKPKPKPRPVPTKPRRKASPPPSRRQVRAPRQRQKAPARSRAPVWGSTQRARTGR